MGGVHEIRGASVTTWSGLSAAPMLYIGAGGFHGGNPGALVRKKYFQAGGLTTYFNTVLFASR